MKSVVETKDETATPGAHILHVVKDDVVGVTKDQDILPNDPKDGDHDLMGPSFLDNMEISMVHVPSAEFQPTTSQQSFLDGDVVAKEKLRPTLAELFPCFLAVNLNHMKPLYVTAHIEGYPISKVFVDCGATVNIMLISIMKALRHSKDEIIPSCLTMSSFVGDKSQTKKVLPLEVNITGRNHMTTFVIVDSKIEYNALFDCDWIHQTDYIPSSLY
ncbi:hypothetical protein ACFX1Q_013923 [Malus domestica]